MCCFNLSDNKQPIEKQLQELHDLAKQIKQNIGMSGLWDWLTSWLPEFCWLKQIFVYGLILTGICIAFCCFLQCLPSLIQLGKNAFGPRSPQVMYLRRAELRVLHKNLLPPSLNKIKKGRCNHGHVLTLDSTLLITLPSRGKPQEIRYADLGQGCAFHTNKNLKGITR